MKRIAVILSGCGYLDGAEITESVSTLVSLSKRGVRYKCFAPDVEVAVTNHRSGKGTPGVRNVLDEAARIARGKVQSLESLNPSDFDGLVFPGGYGAALTLCDFGKEGAKGTVDMTVQRVIMAFYESKKPICGICISPALLALALKGKGITVTIGNDSETAEQIQATGSQHENCPVTDYVSDRDHKIVTTPAYMYDEAKPHEVFEGVGKAVSEFLEMA